jgi:hypothetical protein
MYSASPPRWLKIGPKLKDAPYSSTSPSRGNIKEIEYLALDGID